MKKEKTQKQINTKIIYKILIPTILTVITISIVLAVRCYNVHKRNLISNGVSYIALLSRVALNSIDNIYFERVTPDSDPNSDEYLDSYKNLMKIKSIENIDNIYTLYFKDDTFYYGVIASKNKNFPKHIGDTYSFKIPLEEALKKIRMGGTVYTDHIVYDGDTPYIIAVTPLFNSLGELIGGIGCEYNATSIIKTLSTSTKKIILITLLLIIISTILLSLIIHKIISNLTKINNKMITLASNEGDLTQQLTIHSGDEIETMADNTNFFISSIRNIIIKLKDNTNNLENNISDSFMQMQETYDSINKSDSSLININSSMDNAVKLCTAINTSSNELIETINQLNSLINEGASKSVLMNQLAKDSNKKNTTNYNLAVEKAKLLSKELINNLEKAKEISKISNLAKTIIEVTEQTNLLALNASIESARSGEYGKEFVIVAESIRKLATMTELSASQIEKVSNNIISSVNDLTTSAHTILDYLENVLFNGYNELVEYSNIYQSDSNELLNIFTLFLESTQSLTSNISNMQNSIKLTIDDINSSAMSIEDITVLSCNLTEKNKQLYSQFEEIKKVCDNLNLSINKFKV